MTEKYFRFINPSLYNLDLKLFLDSTTVTITSNIRPLQHCHYCTFTFTTTTMLPRHPLSLTLRLHLNQHQHLPLLLLPLHPSSPPTPLPSPRYPTTATTTTTVLAHRLNHHHHHHHHQHDQSSHTRLPAVSFHPARHSVKSWGLKQLFKSVGLQPRDVETENTLLLGHT